MAAAPLTLYSYWRSTTSYRVRAALNIKGVAYRIEPIDLLAGAQHHNEYSALNPAKGVPTLILADGTVLTQSMAILDFIEETWPDPPLVPRDPLARARVLETAYAVAIDIHPVNNLRVVRHLQDVIGADAEAAMTWMQHWIQQGFEVYETLVSDTSKFAFGDTPDLSDLCLVAQTYNAHRWGVDLSPFPNILRVEAACLAVPAIAAAHPDQQPDAQ